MRAFLRAYRADPRGPHGAATIPLICGTLQALGRGPVELTIPDANADALTLSFDPTECEIHASVTIARNIKWKAAPLGPKVDGIETHRLERTLDPNDPDSWEGVGDIGASRHRHIIGSSPGLYWFRVKSTRAGHDPAYIGPVSVLVTWAPRKAARAGATRKARTSGGSTRR
ncbi:Hypothetical protein A7982_06656 [Minicystis rosea]|nr:Hypothetical protein A7982_06656 [Minicystis rosea]